MMGLKMRLRSQISFQILNKYIQLLIFPGIDIWHVGVKDTPKPEQIVGCVAC